MTNSKVAVIGLGNIGQALSTNFSKSERLFIVADRSVEKAELLSENWGDFVESSSIQDAVKNADILILAIPFQAISGFLKDYETDLEGKIIIDPSNPIAPDDNGGFKKIIGENESAGELISKKLPKDAKLVKAFGTLGVASLSNSAFQTPEKAVLFYATDDSDIDFVIEQLIADNGFNACKVGGIDQSIRIEVFGDLHEFGALGKTVNINQAKNAIG
jgi:hypothetical protein